MTAPLHELTRKNVRFKWGPDQEEAFPLFKEKLPGYSILCVGWRNLLSRQGCLTCCASGRVVSGAELTGRVAGLCFENAVPNET